MYQKLIFITIVVILLPFSVYGETKKARAAKARLQNCTTCHVDFTSVLPKNHKPVTGKNIASCLSCHKPIRSLNAERNIFSSRLHRAHAASNVSADCMVCHTWRPGKSFGLPNSSINLGQPSREEMALTRPIFTSWASSSFTDATHAKANVMCAGCHGKNFAEEGDSVEKERCQSCHGGYRELAAKTQPSDFPDRNPHRSHLGEVECNVCHKAHGPSSVYCLKCHPKFPMRIMGAGGQTSKESSRFVTNIRLRADPIDYSRVILPGRSLYSEALHAS